MRISTSVDYVGFRNIVQAFPSADLRHVFYKKSGSDVVEALALFHSPDHYVQMDNIGPGIVTETAFLSDFPAAVNAEVTGSYDVGLTCAGGQYSNFQAVIAELGTGIAQVFYSKFVLAPTYVSSALILFHSNRQYVQAGFNSSNVSVTTFTTDYPSAVEGQTSASY